MRKLAIFVVRHSWLVLALAVIAIIVSGILGAGVHDRLSGGGFEDPSTESNRRAEEVAKAFPQASLSDFVLVVTAKDGTVDSDAVTRQATDITRRLRKAEGVAAADSYWTLGKVEQLRSRDSRRALIVAALRGEPDEKIKIGGKLAEEFGVDNAVLVAIPTGESALTHQISDQAEKDLQKSELITAPLTAIALVIVFGSVVAAVLPLTLGAIAVLGTFLVLTVLTLFTTVSVFALNLTTALGLGLAIDYSLFVVSRYREEMARGVSSNVAVGRSMQTAGRTVAFSAGTVMISLASLAVFDVPYLRSFAFAGVAVVALAALAAIVVLPAVLAILGTADREGPRVQAQARVGDRGLLGRPGPPGDEAPGALRRGGQPRAPAAGGAVLPPRSRPDRRPCGAPQCERPAGGGPDPRGFRLAGVERVRHLVADARRYPGRQGDRGLRP